MTQYIFGTVVLARIPYTDQIQTKLRPAVIINSHKFFECHQDVLLLSISSKTPEHLPFLSQKIIDWQEAGLPKPSFFKPTLFTLMSYKIEKIFGMLSAKDTQNAQQLLKEMLILS